MGNCSLKGVATAKALNSVRIMMDSGNILELEPPKLVHDVVSGYPGYGIFRQGRASSPLFDHEKLLAGQFYYLLPLPKLPPGNVDLYVPKPASILSTTQRPPTPASELVMNIAEGSGLEVLPPPRKGFWRVKLVINTKQLEEILSEQVNTEALIEQMRMAALSGKDTTTRRRSKSYWGASLKPEHLFLRN